MQVDKSHDDIMQLYNAKIKILTQIIFFIDLHTILFTLV